ncbi:MAG: SgcJ/EcaC family oxidoreductase [Desulfovermiculus sp.]
MSPRSTEGKRDLAELDGMMEEIVADAYGSQNPEARCVDGNHCPSTGSAHMGQEGISHLLQLWLEALETGDPRTVALLYESNSILLPTVSNQVRHNRQEIQDYFVHFLAQEPKGTVQEENIRTYGQLAINSGVYTFAFSDGSWVQARFSFVYRWNGQQWMIVEHHSSRMPE